MLRTRPTRSAVDDYAAAARKRRGGRQPLYGEKIVLVNFTVPKKLRDELDETRSTLGKPTLVEFIRQALGDYVERHRGVDLGREESKRAAREPRVTTLELRVSLGPYGEREPRRQNAERELGEGCDGWYPKEGV